MSKKINPNAMRIGVTKPWKSLWYAENGRYADAVVEDDKIRTYLTKSLRTSGLDELIIERSIKAVKILIRVSRPGVVIGRKGVGLSQIREDLKKITKSEIDLQIEEVKKPEGRANIIAEAVAMQVERRVSARRAINIAADKAIEAGVLGVKVQIGGTVHGPNSIGTSFLTTRGAVPTQTIRADVEYAKAVAHTRGGTIGVKVWVYHGEIENANT